MMVSIWRVSLIEIREIGIVAFLLSNALMYQLSSTNTDRSMKGPVSKIIILIKNKGLLLDT